jgi:hypothetical protein
MVKFKIGFTIPSETLFSMVAKFLPIEDLHVEEIMEQQPKIIQSKIAKLIATMPDEKISTERKKYRTSFKHPSGKTLPELVIEFMEKSKGDLTWAAMSKFAQSIGYEKSSINNAVARLIERNLIEKKSAGIYGLKKK